MEERLLGMALKAQVAGALVSQHVTVDRSVGNVTGNAPFHRNHFVLEEPRTAVFGVTLEATLVFETAENRALAPGVGIVAILTLDAALGHRMPIRK
jgi:hypothetical protein